MINFERRKEIENNLKKEQKPINIFKYYLNYLFNDNWYLIGYNDLEYRDLFELDLKRKNQAYYLFDEYPYEIWDEWKKEKK